MNEHRVFKYLYVFIIMYSINYSRLSLYSRIAFVFQQYHLLFYSAGCLYQSYFGLPALNCANCYCSNLSKFDGEIPHQQIIKLHKIQHILYNATTPCIP